MMRETLDARPETLDAPAPRETTVLPLDVVAKRIEERLAELDDVTAAVYRARLAASTFAPDPRAIYAAVLAELSR